MRRAVLVLFASLALAPANASAAQVDSVLGIPCTTAADGVQECIGSVDHRVPTWDGVPLDVDVFVPPAARSGPFPAVFFLHGFGGSKSGADRAMAQDGYVVVQYSARGFGNSCGLPPSRTDPGCVRGWAHLGDVRYEARDTQQLAGLLADAGLVKPTAIGVTGTSYGAGQSLLLAALRDRVALPDGQLVPWRSPQGTPMAIAASAPNWPWSDLAAMLIPNGHTLDYMSDPRYGRVGMPEVSYVGLLTAAGGGLGYFSPPGIDFSSDAFGWVARYMAGDPYDDAVATDVVKEIRRFHSPLGVEAGLRRGQRVKPAPTFINTSWPDDLTTTTEALRWRNDVLKRFRRAEVDLLFSDGGGHWRAVGSTPDLAELQRAFFDRLLTGTRGEPLGVRTLTQACNGAEPQGPFDTASWPAQHPGEVRFAASPEARTITGTAPDHNAAAVDPIAGSTAAGGSCITVDANDAPVAATYRFPAATGGGYTLMGRPTVIARLRATSRWAQVAARLWDVAPDGTQSFVARVAYRPRANDSRPQVFQLQANGWHFAEGHVPKLELLGQDNPYVRPSNTPFTVTIEDLSLRLPVRERPDGGQVRRPARMLDRMGRPLPACSARLAAELRARCGEDGSALDRRD
jgi:predicted acyl esterase